MVNVIHRWIRPVFRVAYPTRGGSGSGRVGGVVDDEVGALADSVVGVEGVLLAGPAFPVRGVGGAVAGQRTAPAHGLGSLDPDQAAAVRPELGRAGADTFDEQV